MKPIPFLFVLLPLAGTAQNTEKPAKAKLYNTDACPTWGADTRAKSRADYLQFLVSETDKSKTEEKKGKARTSGDASYSIIPAEEAKTNTTHEFYTRRRYNVVPEQEETPVVVNDVPGKATTTEKPVIPEATVPAQSQMPEPETPKTESKAEEKAETSIPETVSEKPAPEANPVKTSPEANPGKNNENMPGENVGSKKVKKRKHFRLFHKNGVKKTKNKKTNCPSF